MTRTTTIDPLQHTKLVWSIVNRYSCPGLDPDDLFQEGFLGLLRAAQLFDPSRKLQFSTYATRWIRAKVVNAIREQGHLIRLPRDFWYKNPRTGTREAALKVANACFIRDHEEGTRLADLVVDHSQPPPLEPDFHPPSARDFLTALDRRQRYAIERRYGLTGDPPESLEKIAQHLECSKEYVRQICLKGCRRLRIFIRHAEREYVARHYAS